MLEEQKSAWLKNLIIESHSKNILALHLEGLKEEKKCFNNKIDYLDPPTKILFSDNMPKSGLENYLDLLAVWKAKDMKNLKDFLVYYNNLDVGPMVQAIEKFIEFYEKEKNRCFQNCNGYSRMC